MQQGTVNRALAVASAAAVAGAAVVVGGAGVASAAPVSASGSKSGVSYTRTVSNDAPVWGDEVTIKNRVTRGANWWMVYWIEDVKPECFEYIPDSATWTVGGTTYTQATKPGEVFVTDTSTKIDPPAANSWVPPIDFTAKYRVRCDAGTVNTGGPKWTTTNVGGAANFSSNGPTVTVRRANTSLFLKAFNNPQVGNAVALEVDAPGVPNGGVVTFTADGQAVGTGVVADGKALFSWVPSAPGTKQVAASFAQTGTHLAAVSNLRPIVISAQNANSSVALNVAGSPTVGQNTQITAEVSPAGAGGTVDFKVNNVVIDTVLVGPDAKATSTWIPSASGQVSIDAEFSGRPGVNPGQAPGVSVAVAAADPNQVATSTLLDPIPVTPLGESVVLRATVGPEAAGGTITFHDGQNPIATVPVGANGVATFTWTPGSAGERTIRAVFSGNGAYLASQGTVQAVITPAIVVPGPDPVDPPVPTTGSLGSITDSLGAGGAGGSLGSLGG